MSKGLLKAKGKSFYWASCLLSKKQAITAAELYAICRQADDLVDESSSASEASKKLILFRDETLQGSFFQQAQINKQAFVALTQGVESDLGVVRIENEAELLQYCYQVAGTVGIMMCDVLEVSDPKALQHAVNLGIAMQITNICRDVVADAHLGRRYLPATLVGQISIEDLAQPSKPQIQIVTSALRVLLHLADRYYESGNEGIVYLPLRARFGIFLAGRLYRQIGVKLGNRDCNYWERRISLSIAEKIIVTLKSLILFVSTPAYWKVFSKPALVSRWK